MSYRTYLKHRTLIKSVMLIFVLYVVVICHNNFPDIFVSGLVKGSVTLLLASGRKLGEGGRAITFNVRRDWVILGSIQAAGCKEIQPTAARFCQMSYGFASSDLGGTE